MGEGLGCGGWGGGEGTVIMATPEASQLPASCSFTLSLCLAPPSDTLATRQLAPTRKEALALRDLKIRYPAYYGTEHEHFFYERVQGSQR